MPDHYLKLSDLPKTLKVFPLRGVIMLPRSSLPLNVFEPRYLTLVNDLLAGDRLIGFVQPVIHEDAPESPEGKDIAFGQTGGAARLTAFQEADDGRYLVTISGVARFTITGEEKTDCPYRVCSVDWSPYEHDLKEGFGED